MNAKLAIGVAVLAGFAGASKWFGLTEGAPTVKDQGVFFMIPGGGAGNINFQTSISFLFNFDQAIYIKNRATGNLVAIDHPSLLAPQKATANYSSQMYMSGNITVPLISVMGNDMFNITCNGAARSSKFSQGSPFYLSPPANDPSASFLNLYFGGLFFNTTYWNNRVAFTYFVENDWWQVMYNPPPGSSHEAQPAEVSGNSILPTVPSGTATNGTGNATASGGSSGSPSGGSSSSSTGGFQQFVQPSCVFRENPASEYVLTDAAGNSINFGFNATSGVPACTPEGATAIMQNVNQLLTMAKSLKGVNALNQFQLAAKIMTSTNTFQGCDNMLNQYYEYGPADIPIHNTFQCGKRYDDPAWATDPCCNWALYQCCAPHDDIFRMYVVQSLTTAKLNTCANPGAVAALLFNAATATNARHTSSMTNSWDTWNSYHAFMDKCNNLVFNTQCKADTDCLYSGSCGQNGYCAVDWVNPGPVLIKCYLAKMPADLLLQFKSDLQLPTTFESEDYAVSNLTAAVAKFASTVDCVGPTGYLYHSNTTFSQDSSNNWVPTFNPGDMNGCLRDQQCNYRPWERTTNTTCLQDNLAGFCAQNNNGWVNPVGYPNECTLQPPWDITNDQLKTLCTAAGGNIRGDYPRCYLDNLTANVTTCLNATITGASTCRLDQSASNWRCSSSMCYGPQNQTACNSLGWNSGAYWDSGVSRCVFWSKTYATCTSPLKFEPGRIFNDGRFATQSNCPNATCNMWNTADGTSIDIANATQCSTAAYCSQPCPRCRSWNYPTGGCYNATALTSSACNAASGSWKLTSGQIGTGCMFDSYSGNSAACLAANLTFVVRRTGTDVEPKSVQQQPDGLLDTSCRDV
ncbi:hypothetical protein HDU91_002803 [Kappamyces sp. JEL0680]|nr:hypothetical protein HDU91_002803 [Kappamyces sp. JEL0680]